MISVLTSLFLLGCQSGSEPPPATTPEVPSLSEEEAWERARKTLTAGRGCFRRTKEYCVTDKDVVDGHVQAQLDRLFDGKMPARERDVGEVERKAALSYAQWSRSAEAAPLVAKAVAAYYEEPDLTEYEGKGVSLRLGVLPGTLEVVPDEEEGKDKLVMSTDLAKDGEILGSELARLMQKVQAEHAEHPAIRLAYQVPFEDPEFRLMDVRWTVETGLLEIRDGTYPRHYWRGEVKDWAAVAAGTVSVGLRDLELCERVKEGEPTCEKGAMPPDSAKKGERSKSAKAKSKSPKPKPKPAE